MAGTAGVRCWRRFAALAIVLYCVFLVTAQFEHHDLACHLKTPLHCMSCASSPLSVNPRTPLAPDACRLTDAGRAVFSQPLSESVLLATHSSGRSPPALA
jgi:hypothetical protein